MHSHKVNIREHSVHDWWMVCLNKGWVLSHNDDWSVNMTLNKNDLFEVYRKSCVGESYGRLMFWTHFHRLVQFVDQTNMTVDIHSLPKCRIHLPKWNRWNSEHKRVFASSGLPQVDVNSVHNWWNVCLANGRITGLKTDGWKDGEMKDGTPIVTDGFAEVSDIDNDGKLNLIISRDTFIFNFEI